MATSTLADVALTQSWADLIVTHATLASAEAVIQNVGTGKVNVVFGGTVPDATGKTGIVLRPDESCSGVAAAVWARSVDKAGAVSVTLL